jgi:hypothetical protein
MDGQQLLINEHSQQFRKFNENTRLPHSVIISTNARVTAMTKSTKCRILSFRNSRVEDNKTYVRNKFNNNEFVKCSPTKWTRVICNVCFKDIFMHQIYFARNNRFRGKYCHVTCAHRKNMVNDNVMDELFNENPGYLTLDQTGNIIMTS